MTMAAVTNALRAFRNDAGGNRWRELAPSGVCCISVMAFLATLSGKYRKP